MGFDIHMIGRPPERTIRETHHMAALVRQKKEDLMPTITTYHRGDMLFESILGNHSLEIDVPASMGGGDRDPTPPEVFIASLGSCVGAFVANYCHNVGINDEGMTVDMSYDKADDPTRLVNLQVVVKLPTSEVGRRRTGIPLKRGLIQPSPLVRTSKRVRAPGNCSRTKLQLPIPRCCSGSSAVTGKLTPRPKGTSSPTDSLCSSGWILVAECPSAYLPANRSRSTKS